MGIFRKNNDTAPLIPPSSETTTKILRTYEHLDLDPSQTILVGSAAAALYGVLLEPYDIVTGQYSSRPSDLDFAASPRYMQDMYATLPKTPDPLVPEAPWVTRKEIFSPRTVIRIHTPEPDLPVDMITSFDDERATMARFHGDFLAYHERHSRPLDGSTMRVISMQALMNELKLRAPFDPKAATDLADLRRSQVDR